MIDFEQKLLDLNDRMCDLSIKYDTLKEDYDRVCDQLASEMKDVMRYRQLSIEYKQKIGKQNDTE